MRNMVIAALRSASEPEYAAFTRKLCPDTARPILGVRLPKLRTVAKDLTRGDWRAFLAQARRETYEETMVEGLVIAYAKAGLEEKLGWLEPLLYALDSWALTDSIAPTLRFSPQELPRVWDFAQSCLAASHTYVRRFSLILMLDHFLTPEYLEQVAKTLEELRDQRYYVRMAAAWLLAELAIHDYGRAVQVLASGRLDDFTQNKSIRKMRESYRLTPAQKEALLPYRRKEEKP